METFFEYNKDVSINSLNELLTTLPKNEVIVNNFIKAWKFINDDKYKSIICSISGGSDSDIVLDICCRCDIHRKIQYVFFDTGLEYNATKRHLKYLKEKYAVNIDILSAYKIGKCIPVAVKEYGQPFISKQVSEFISRLQKHNFQWENESLENLLKKYPKCKSALEWWCCEKGINSSFNITRNKWLKEFISENPPQFKISNKCCKYAKKDLSKYANYTYESDLSIVGVRKAEGGARAAAYKNCFSENENSVDSYRPIFWYKNSDKEEYEKHFNIKHSECYTKYGLIRTGCVGCPFSRDLENELYITEKYEPNLHKAICNIFKDSYEYTRKYRDFVIKKNSEERRNKCYQEGK